VEFAKKVRLHLKIGREMPEKRVLRKHVGFEDVVAVVERLTGEKWGAFSERHGDKRRDLVLWVARRCTGLTLAELGQKANGMDYAAVTMAVRRFPAILSGEPERCHRNPVEQPPGSWGHRACSAAAHTAGGRSSALRTAALNWASVNGCCRKAHAPRRIWLRT